MTTQEVKRKLAAILSADVKGYSRLMGEDEVGTIHTLNAYKEVMAGLIQHHHGRVVDAPGDNVLAEFGSVVDAVQCAVEVQKELKTRNTELPENRRMEFRIGVNLGDVVEDGEQILGDGVNIAARLESLSDAGGICISGTAFDQVENKLSLGYEYLGEQTVKNIAKAVRVYRVLMGTEAVAMRGLEVASKEKMAFPLPDQPSIAVLPFENMSGDPKQEFFSDGITETIITALSNVPNLFVIARNSTFTYKGKPVKVKQVSEELGVRYVLEGSVQKSGDRIRINAQLIDALTGRHIWAERYNRDLTDIFALQDEITIKILMAIQVKLTGEDRPSIAEKYFTGKQSLDCWLKIMEGFSYLQAYNIDSTRMGRRIAEEAIDMCPENPMTYHLMGVVNYLEYWLGLGKSPQESIEKGIELAQKALAIDDSSPMAHSQLSLFCSLKGEHERAIAEGERAVALMPGGATVNWYYGIVLLYGGRPEEAIQVLQKAVRLNPLGESNIFLYIGHTYRVMGRFEEAISGYKEAVRRAPDNIFAHLSLAATYIMMGREQEGRAEAAEVLRINPKFQVDYFANRLTYKDHSAMDSYVDALRKAGLK